MLTSYVRALAQCLNAQPLASGKHAATGGWETRNLRRVIGLPRRPMSRDHSDRLPHLTNRSWLHQVGRNVRNRIPALPLGVSVLVGMPHMGEPHTNRSTWLELDQSFPLGCSHWVGWGSGSWTLETHPSLGGGSLQRVSLLWYAIVCAK